MIKAVWHDLVKSMRRMPMAFYFAWTDTKARYRRSVLGPLWLVLGTGISVVGMGYLWSALLHQPHEVFVPALAVGLVIWQLISGCLMDAPSMLVQAGSWIRNVKTPYFFFSIQLVLKHLINFAHHALVILLVFLIYPSHFNAIQWLAFPGLALVIVNLFWIVMLLGLLGARFRDFQPMINALMPVLFFLSPVIFQPEQLGSKAFVMWCNPLTYLIALVRSPLQGVIPPWWVYGVAVGGFFVGMTLVVLLMRRTLNRIVFWI